MNYLGQPFQSLLCTTLFKSYATQHLIWSSHLLTWVTIQHYFSFCHWSLKGYSVFKITITDQQTTQFILSGVNISKKLFMHLSYWFILSSPYNKISMISLNLWKPCQRKMCSFAQNNQCTCRSFGANRWISQSSWVFLTGFLTDLPVMVF